MTGQGTPSLVETTLAVLLLLLVGVALVSWLWPVLSDPALYSPTMPIGIRGLG
jgi:hypothetical protein